MRIELINTGSELMLGNVLNTHQQWLCAELFALGYEVQRQVAIPDTSNAILDAVRDALSRSDLVLVTGGLGPTSDDLTRDQIALLLGKKLIMDERVSNHIDEFFRLRGRPAPPATKVQALVPEGAQVLMNAHGTAPGLVLKAKEAAASTDVPNRYLILLPGPPRELRPMFTSQVVPWLKEEVPASAIRSITFSTTGLGESLIEGKIAAPLADLVREGLEVGYCARLGEVDLRLIARGPVALDLTERASVIVRRLIGKHIYSENGERLESVLIRLLHERGATLSLAESCTGGLLANRLTNVPGASTALWGGCVTYSNEAKQRMLDVRGETLEAHGAVSRETALEMAQGIQRRSGTEYALAVTGIAGPTGGVPSKPLGTVFIALASKNQVRVIHHLNPYDRETFKFVTSQQAFEMLRRHLLRD